MRLGQPARALKILKTLLDEVPGELPVVMAKLRVDQVAALLEFATSWNTKTKDSREAQVRAGDACFTFEKGGFLIICICTTYIPVAICLLVCVLSLEILRGSGHGTRVSACSWPCTSSLHPPVLSLSHTI